MMSDSFSTDRRTLIKGAAASAALLAPAAGLAQSRRAGDRDAIRAAVDAGYEDIVRRIQQWIALPTIAAEQLNIQEGADYMARLATEAGFTGVRKIPTGGSPAVFGRIDAGAQRTVGIYFMYDVKQYDPAEWASPPLEGRIFDHAAGPGDPRPRRGQPEGAGRRLPRRAPRLPRRGPAAAGQSRPARRGRGGDRLAAISPTRCAMPRCSRRCAGSTASSSRPPRRARTARSPSASAPRASSSASWSRRASAGGAGRRATSIRA